MAHDAFVRTDRREPTDGLEDEHGPLAASGPLHGPPRPARWFHYLHAARNDEVDAIERLPSGPSLEDEVADFATMIAGQDWATADPLGLGGLLADAARVAQLMNVGAFAGTDLLDALLAAALRGLTAYARQGDLRHPASRRLAFRELGLAIGLSAVELIEESVRTLAPHLDLGAGIRSFWLEPRHRETRIWSEHRDINEVMLATSLVPDGFLRIE